MRARLVVLLVAAYLLAALLVAVTEPLWTAP